MEQTLELLNPKIIIGEPAPIIKYHCKTTEKSKNGLLFKIGCTLDFRNDIKEIKFEFKEFKEEPNNTRYYRASITLDINLFNFIASNIQTAKLIMDDDEHETPQDKVQKMKLVF